MSCFWKGSPSDRYLSGTKISSDIVENSIDSDDRHLNEVIHQCVWKYTFCMPVDSILEGHALGYAFRATLEDWHTFIKEERLWASKIGEHTYYDDLWDWWSAEPSTTPIVVSVRSFKPLVLNVNHSHGIPLIFDGNHRLALAIEHGWTHVPCFLGKPK